MFRLTISPAVSSGRGGEPLLLFDADACGICADESSLAPGAVASSPAALYRYAADCLQRLHTRGACQQRE